MLGLTLALRRAAVAVVCALTLLAPSTAGAQQAATAQTYYPFGPQTDVASNDLQGWQICFSGGYDLVESVDNIVQACDGTHLMLAALPTYSTTFTVLAAAPIQAVLFDTADTNSPTNANGSGWYFNSSHSWGFALEGDPINRSPCDIGTDPAYGPNAALRLCWNTSAGSVVAGWRAGANVALSDGSFTRQIYEADLTFVDPNPRSVTFPEQTVSTSSEMRSINVYNMGSRDLMTFLQLDGPHSGDFSFSAPGCADPIPPGGSCVAGVVFTPQGEGARSATLLVGGNTEMPVAVSLDGVGVAQAPEPTPTPTPTPSPQPTPQPTPEPTPQPTPIEPPRGPAPVLSPVDHTWRYFKKFSQVNGLTVRLLPAGSTVAVKCSGKGCPFRAKSQAFTTAASRASLTSLFKKKARRKGRRKARRVPAKLAVRTKIQVTITVPNMIGKVVTFTIRPGRVPSVATSCLPPGAASPQPC